MLKTADIRFISEHTLLVEFGQTLDDATHQKVLKLDAALANCPIKDLIETLPTFRSLSIEFDPFVLSPDKLVELVMALDFDSYKFTGDRWRVPVCFEQPYAEDLEETAKVLGISRAHLIKRVLESKFKVYMFGFVPGFAYLGGLDEALHIPRRKTPRPPVPPGSLIIAGGLAGFMPIAMPTGWYVLAQSPVCLFSDTRSPMVPFAVGDQLKFYAVDAEKHLHLQALNKQKNGPIAGIEPDE